MLNNGDSRDVLGLVADAIQNFTPDFPDRALTEALRRLFQAEFAGAGQIDCRGAASYRWADSPQAIAMGADSFHDYAARHPLAQAYRSTKEPVPLRLSDVASPREAPPAVGDSGMSRVLTIPLAISTHRVSAIALLRGGSDFTAGDVRLACKLQPILGGLYSLRGRLVSASADQSRTGADPTITARELSVLTLMAEGLITPAIAHRLGISPHTVGKHIEHLYEKLGTHDRTSTILRSQVLGILPPRTTT
jgi:DNA-binding CsgD family transcriptional regulator